MMMLNLMRMILLMMKHVLNFMVMQHFEFIETSVVEGIEDTPEKIAEDHKGDYDGVRDEEDVFSVV